MLIHPSKYNQTKIEIPKSIYKMGGPGVKNIFDLLAFHYTI